MSVWPEKHESVVPVARIAELKVVSATLSMEYVVSLEIAQGRARVTAVFPDERVIPTMMNKAKPRFMVPRWVMLAVLQILTVLQILAAVLQQQCPWALCQLMSVP
jgi:hypothetical protein